MGKWVHRLSAVNEEHRIGLCSHCGPVRLAFKGYSRHAGRQKLYACVHATRARDEKAPSNEKEAARNEAKVRWVRKMTERYPTYRSPFMGTCPICDRYELLVFDHDHAKDEARDQICNLCNSILGFAKDSPVTLIQAAIYLLRHQ